MLTLSPRRRGDGRRDAPRLEPFELTERHGATGGGELVVAPASVSARAVRSVVSATSPSSTRRFKVPYSVPGPIFTAPSLSSPTRRIRAYPCSSPSRRATRCEVMLQEAVARPGSYSKCDISTSDSQAVIVVTMDATPEQVSAGHAFYTKRSLAVYDARDPGLLLPGRMEVPGPTDPRTTTTSTSRATISTSGSAPATSSTGAGSRRIATGRADGSQRDCLASPNARSLGFGPRPTRPTCSSRCLRRPQVRLDRHQLPAALPSGRHPRQGRRLRPSVALANPDATSSARRCSPAGSSGTGWPAR